MPPWNLTFLFPGPPEPGSHRDQVQSSVHWAALGLFGERKSPAHLTFQVQSFPRGLECRYSLLYFIKRSCFMPGTTGSPHSSGKASPRPELCRDTSQRDRCYLSSPSPSSILREPLLPPPGPSQVCCRLALPAVATTTSTCVLVLPQTSIFPAGSATYSDAHTQWTGWHLEKDICLSRWSPLQIARPDRSGQLKT